jgi:hypothetical protein
MPTDWSVDERGKLTTRRRRAGNRTISATVLKLKNKAEPGTIVVAEELTGRSGSIGFRRHTCGEELAGSDGLYAVTKDRGA